VGPRAKKGERRPEGEQLTFMLLSPEMGFRLAATPASGSFAYRISRKDSGR